MRISHTDLLTNTYIALFDFEREFLYSEVSKHERTYRVIDYDYSINMTITYINFYYHPGLELLFSICHN